MNISKMSLSLALVLLLSGAGFAAKTSITGLKLGKDKAISQEEDTFGSQDKIFAAAQVSSVTAPVTVKGWLVVDDVPGQQRGPIPGLEAMVKLERSGTANFNFSAPTKGWPKGTYIVDVVVLNGDGDELDKKSAEFSVE